ncbi:hypothetical protein KUV62_10250 [Salipiger bermudensis]|uniref:hypothetical protein n=1 Tax=Salipiger bermudensis TaxID=344736 RepID=UPI001C996E40|nr:hypothetical protein [Salipiger bermudensis]MBY6004291.1 hypothetical protein [Salipiger bermudensis]
MTERSLGRTLWTLFLAVLNATLILLALCLWLGWSLFSTVESITGDVAEITGTIRPLRSEIQGLTTQIGETRSALAALREDGADLQLCSALEAQLARMETRVAELTETLQGLEAELAPAIAEATVSAFGSLGSAFATTLLGAIGLAPDPDRAPQP